ncbi:hydrolase [Bacillus solimangrovi]|uniref:Hydrolase n=1 Tax=Bacillus solimangrovi TaxID=1305675 RepID=A0A1E5LDJ0_9BACI|nr:hydrolase [Bacillus solimangrovi]OEH92109.1 hydrolase [Bacillus solimangrovi]
MEKKKYYVAVGPREISQVKDYALNQFEIEATDNEIAMLREVFDDAYSADWLSYWRAHIPYVQYHHDKENDMYDRDLMKAYQMIYELGSNETKEQIQEMGILSL